MTARLAEHDPGPETHSALINTLMTAPIKSRLQHALRRLRIYHRLKRSLVYDAYWSVARPALLQSRRREVEFYRRTLVGFPAKGLVFDIGANQGQKTDVFLRLGARVVAVHPDELNERILREKFLSLRWVRP